jgi:hypothetical protein
LITNRIEVDRAEHWEAADLTLPCLLQLLAYGFLGFNLFWLEKDQRAIGMDRATGYCHDRLPAWMSWRFLHRLVSPGEV